MDNFGDVLGGLLSGIFGGDESAEGRRGPTEMFGPGGRREGESLSVYERYLCGGPRELNINDR